MLCRRCARLLAALGAIVATILVCSCRPPGPNPPEHHLEGEISVTDLLLPRAGVRAEDALPYLDRAIDGNADDALATGARGIVRMALAMSATEDAERSEHLEKAGADLQSAAMGRPNHAVVQYYLGLWALETGEVELAGHHFEMSVERDPGGLSAYRGLGLSLLLTGTPEAVLERIGPAADRFDDPKLRYFVAAANLSAGNLDEAIEAAQRSVEAADTAEARITLASGYSRRGDLASAAAELRLALEIEPRNRAARLGLVTTLGKQGEENEAVAEATRALEFFPGDQDFTRLLVKWQR